MKSSLRLGTVSGISIGMHWTVAIIAFLAGTTVYNTALPSFAPGYTAAQYLVATVAIVAAFLGSIVAHELGHSIVAQRNRVSVRSITLFALGGVAALEREPDTPGAAARIALAGPAVSLALGLAGVGGALAASSVGLGSLVASSLAWIGFINLTLAVFNMIPALPLDGGRVLQAALWQRRGERLTATISAARLGRWLGVAIILFGLWQFATTGDGLWTAFIGWFVAVSARAEGRRARWQLRRQRAVAASAAGPSMADLASVLFGPPRQAPIDVSGRPLNSDPLGR